MDEIAGPEASPGSPWPSGAAQARHATRGRSVAVLLFAFADLHHFAFQPLAFGHLHPKRSIGFSKIACALHALPCAPAPRHPGEMPARSPP
jgi:hypothetical protein